MLDRVEFLISEAFIALRRNTWMTFAAVTTVAMALYLLGGIGYLYTRISTYVDTVKDSYQVRVFLKEGLEPGAITKAQTELKSIDGVKSVTFIPKAEGLKRFIAKNPNIDVSDLKNDNPLPNSFEVKVKDISMVPEIASDIERKSFVEPKGVQKSNELQTFLEDSLQQLRILGFFIGGLMLLTGGVLIYNAIRLTIMARQREMRIMELVGASNFTIVTPLLFEGIIQGVLGGVLASFFLHTTLLFANSAIQSLDAFTKIDPPPPLRAMVWFSIAGAIYGLVCSLIAVRDRRRNKAL